MRRIVFLLTVILLTGACVKSDNEPDFLQVGDKKANLYNAFYHDFGTDENDLTYRKYGIQLVDSDYDPSYYIQFLIYSNSTRELIEGSYIYDFNGGRGTFSFLKAGAALRRDNTGFYISGEVYDDDDGVEVLEGYVDLSRDKSRYVFDFFTSVVKNGDTIDIEGHYSGYMQEQLIDIFEDEE